MKLLLNVIEKDGCEIMENKTKKEANNSNNKITITSRIYFSGHSNHSNFQRKNHQHLVLIKHQRALQCYDEMKMIHIIVIVHTDILIMLD